MNTDDCIARAQRLILESRQTVWAITTTDAAIRELVSRTEALIEETHRVINANPGAELLLPGGRNPE